MRVTLLVVMIRWLAVLSRPFRKARLTTLRALRIPHETLLSSFHRPFIRFAGPYSAQLDL
jgi:hypothetical protein